MTPLHFTNNQNKIINTPTDSSLFIEGPAQCGKTTASIDRISRIIEKYPGYQILIITPQQSLAQPYKDYLLEDKSILGGLPKITTISSLARDLVQLFWPVVKSIFDFSGSSEEPVFLSLETAQFIMSQIVNPLLDKGYFQSVKIDHNRLFSQIIDNLNKTAIHDLPIGEIPSRLLSGATDPSILANAFNQVEECAFLFRSFCIKNNLIDFSLLMDIAHKYLFSEKLPWDYIQARYKVLIADNIEEDTPVAHSFYQKCIHTFPSTTLIFDQQGGFRTFLGAEPDNAYALKALCNHKIFMKDPIETSKPINQLRSGLLSCIEPGYKIIYSDDFPKNIQLSVYQFLPEMVDGVVKHIDNLVRSGVPQDSIAILTPYLSDVVKFSITKKLKALGIQSQTYRPSREYLTSSAIKAILTIAKIAHPEWEMTVSHYEFRNCLMRLIKDIDIIRAEHASKALLANQENGQKFRSFDSLTNISLQECITFNIGKDLQHLSQWIELYKSQKKPPLDIFIQRIFGEILSQPQFMLHNDLDAANEISRIILSFRLFRSFSSPVFEWDEVVTAKTYMESLYKGLLPSSFPGVEQKNQGVLLSPAHTFLMQNRSVDYQFWLDIGSLGWWERLYQPLTNPYIYQNNWKNNTVWDETKEYAINQSMMAKLINGLLLRCKKGMFASIVQTNEYGAQNSGPLLRAFQNLIKNSQKVSDLKNNV